ncbi:hypothetical protein Tco_1457130 [Tanacetum coccineum]
MCDVPLCENTTPLNALNEHSEIVVNSNDDNSSSDDDSTYGEDIDYVDASPPECLRSISLRLVEIVVPEVGRLRGYTITIKDDILREKLLNVNLLIAKIDAFFFGIFAKILVKIRDYVVTMLQATIKSKIPPQTSTKHRPRCFEGYYVILRPFMKYAK